MDRESDFGDASGPEERRFVRFLKTWGPTVVYVTAILLMATRPAPGLPRFRHTDKYFHTAAYTLLALISFRTFLRGAWKYPFGASLLLGAVVGAFDEILQYLGRVRTADVHDWYADLLGTVLGGVIAHSWTRRRKN